jgi:4-aminobutyrate aminotransferase/(S)-3-amino-2-methylpropionate transaminase
MIAFDITAERGGREPDGAAAKAVCARALEQGLVVLSCGVHGETIRILVPLTAPDAIIDEGLDRLEAALAA